MERFLAVDVIETAVFEGKALSVLSGKILDEAELCLRELPPGDERQEDLDNLFYMRQLMANRRFRECSKTGKYTQSLRKETVRISLRSSGPSISLEPKGSNSMPIRSSKK